MAGQLRRPRDKFDWCASTMDSQRAKRQQELELARPLRDYALEIPEPGFGPLDFDLFPYQRAWYSTEVADAEEVVWLKSTQVGMCLRAQTKVLTADLRWVPIESLQVGDHLVSVDEDHGGKPRGRKVRRATVLAKWERVRPVREMVMSDGRVLVASPEHRWLIGRGAKARNTEWRPTKRIEPGAQIRSIVQPWGDPEFEDGWFAGLIDGEGCVRSRALGVELIVTQQEGPIAERARRYLRSRGIPWREWTEQKQGGDVVRLYVSRASDVMRLQGQLRPTKFDVRAVWWEGISPPGTYGDGWATVTEVRDLPVERVVDIETSTGTFIAEGFVSHNSAYAWRWAVRRCDQFGETGVYIFPTDTHVTEFGDERIEPAIEESSYLRSRIPRHFVRHKRLKRIGRGFLHLRGSNSKAGAQSVAAQFLVFDEYDFLDERNLPQIERRITGARQIGKHPRIRRLGTPTLEGHGIGAAYDGSDRREWHVRCPSCDLEQTLSWEENVRWINVPGGQVCRPGHDEYEDPKAVLRVWRCCKACGDELDVSRGRWIARRPGRKVIGFHASRLIVPNTDLGQIVIASRSTKPFDVETFENNDLGRPYSGAEAQLSMAALLAACELGALMVEGYAGPNPVTMGVDVAGERDLSVRVDEQLPALHPNVPNPRRALWIGEVDSFTELERLIRHWRPVQVAIDANPERRMAKALRASFPPGTVVLVEYDARNESEAIKITDIGEAGTPLEGVPLRVRVNRTEAIDSMMDSIRQLRNLPPKQPPARWFDQMRSLKRRTELDSKGRATRVYVTTGTQGDDYAHADVYALVATELWRLRGGVNSAPGDQLVPDEQFGFQRVRLAGDNADIESYSPGFNEGDLFR